MLNVKTKIPVFPEIAKNTRKQRLDPEANTAGRAGLVYQKPTKANKSRNPKTVALVKRQERGSVHTNILNKLIKTEGSTQA